MENAFDEFKTHLAGGDSTARRSKTPERVRQQLWGLLLAQAAGRQRLDPDRLSLVHAVRVLKRRLPQSGP